jgi:hypothetical protein
LLLVVVGPKLINHKLIAYPLASILIIIGIVYCFVAYSEYEDFRELSDMGIKGEMAEKQFEASFFVSSGLVNFVLAVLVIKSDRSVVPYFVSGGISAGLIAIYVASRTVGVPVVGVEYYIGRLDVISKILQGIVIVLSGFAIYSIRTSRALKKII